MTRTGACQRARRIAA